VARILIVGGGCLGRELAPRLIEQGHALRITTRDEGHRPEIESTGAECWIGTPDRLATLRGSLEGVTLACWMLARASGDPEQVRVLHGSRLELFVRQIIDTPVRGLIYDASPGVLPPGLLAGGVDIVRSLSELNAIPLRVLAADADDQGWLAAAQEAVEDLLEA
jgi:hypothetical protein